MLWHVDDLQVSCKDGFEVTKLMRHLDNMYDEKLVLHQGKKGDYLGMNLDFLEPGVFTVNQISYIKDVINDFPEVIARTSPTLHADHLFNIREEEDVRYLPKEQAQNYHHTVAQLLFLSCRACMDIQTAVEFLTTRVKAPDNDDWGKLR